MDELLLINAAAQFVGCTGRTLTTAAAAGEIACTPVRYGGRRALLFRLRDLEVFRERRLDAKAKAA